MKTKSGSCCGEHSQPIPTKGHPHAMHFVMLLAGMGLIYALAGIILLTNINKNQTNAEQKVTNNNTINTPVTTVDVSATATVSVEVI